MEGNTSLRARVLAMEVGDVIAVPMSQYGYTTVRSYASDLSFATGRRYASRRNRETRSYTITRIS